MAGKLAGRKARRARPCGHRHRPLALEPVANGPRPGRYRPAYRSGQGYRDMSGSLGRFEALVLSGKLQTGVNPLLRSSIANASVDSGPAGNRKLSKLRSRGRIDCAVASVTACGMASRTPAEATFEYTGLLLSR